MINLKILNCTNRSCLKQRTKPFPISLSSKQLKSWSSALTQSLHRHLPCIFSCAPRRTLKARHQQWTRSRRCSCRLTCVLETADPAPSVYSMNWRGALPLCSCYNEENAELQCKTDCSSLQRRSKKSTLVNEARITCLLQRNFPLSNITSYNLVQVRIISAWDAQRRNLAMEGA